jgi:hypothetical protein
VTLRDIERSVYRRLNKNVTVPNQETQARIRQFINDRHRDLLTDFPGLCDDVITFASVASQQRYALPEQGIAQIQRIWETTNDRPLEIRDRSWLRVNDADPQTGTPCAWIPVSQTQVHTQPSNASEVFVDSDSASDTCRAYVEGIVTGGYRRKAEVTMTGTTAVTLDSTITSWIQIDKFYLSEEAVGTVTLHEDASGGTELSKIVPGDTYSTFHTFYLYPTPSAVVTYYVDIKRAVFEMANPLDEPLLPVNFHQMLAIGARLDEYEHNDDPARRQIAETEWDRWHKKLTTYVVSKPSTTIDLNAEPGMPSRSRLGAWYPADLG